MNVMMPNHGVSVSIMNIAFSCVRSGLTCLFGRNDRTAAHIPDMPRPTRMTVRPEGANHQ